MSWEDHESKRYTTVGRCTKHSGVILYRATLLATAFRVGCINSLDASGHRLLACAGDAVRIRCLSLSGKEFANVIQFIP